MWFVPEHTLWGKAPRSPDRLKSGCTGSWRLAAGLSCSNSRLTPVQVPLGTWGIHVGQQDPGTSEEASRASELLRYLNWCLNQVDTEPWFCYKPRLFIMTLRWHHGSCHCFPCFPQPPQYNKWSFSHLPPQKWYQKTHTAFLCPFSWLVTKQSGFMKFTFHRIWLLAFVGSSGTAASSRRSPHSSALHGLISAYSTSNLTWPFPCRLALR